LIRPEHLPDFRRPPLNEVVLGVQFKPARGYQQIRAGEVWSLYRSNFPNNQELPPLPPMFETFGPAAVLGGQINFGFATGTAHNRFWFLSPNKDELIQFQQDRLLHNWRKVGDQTNEYPRFERMVVNFENELRLLEQYFSGLVPQKLEINQCEISYINHILSPDGETPIYVKDWLRFLDFGREDQPEDFAINFRTTIRAAEGKPQGRLITEAATGVNQGGRHIIALTLTARGAPAGTDIPGALEFLKSGRELIVTTFAKITTDSAHRQWERVQ
jgi:uncharacterized protein (TIGR04255 family)